MTTPYQQFQGYPDVVGGFTSGQNLGRQRASEDFNMQQTLETQNALLRRSNMAGAGAQSYPDLQAMQMQAKQMMDLYTPALQSAVDNRNYKLRDSIADVLEKTGNPGLVQFSKVARTATKLDDGKFGYDISFDYDASKPESKAAAEAKRDAVYKASPYLQSIYPSSEFIKLNTPYRVGLVGMPGTPDSRMNSFELVSRTQATTKPGESKIDVKDKAQFDELREKYADNQEALDIIGQGEQIYDANPAGGVSLTLPGTGKLGAKAIKSPTQKEGSEVISRPADLEFWKDKTSPEKYEKLLRFAKENPGKQFTINLGTDKKPDGTVKRLEKTAAGGGAGGVGGEFPILKYNAPGKYYGSLFKKPSGETEFATLVSRFLSASVGGRNAFQAVGLSAGKQNDSKREEFLARVSDYMASFGITQTDITDAAGATAVVKKMAPVLAMMKNNALVAEKGFQMVRDLRRRGNISTNLIPMLNHAENVLRTWSGDALPGAAQGVLTEALVDYAKVVSGQTTNAGVTAYAAKMARELMELKDNPKQFEAKVTQYEQLMNARTSGMHSIINAASKATDLGNKGVRYQSPPSGYVATGQKDATGAPLYKSPSGKIVAAPKVQ